MDSFTEREIKEAAQRATLAGIYLYISRVTRYAAQRDGERREVYFVDDILQAIDDYAKDKKIY